MKAVVRDIIFVFGNPITKIQAMANAYDISIVGTNNPARLVEELQNANDVSQYFFIITDEEELRAVNSMLKRLKSMEREEPNMFVIIDKKLQTKLRVGSNSVYVREYQELTESVMTDLVFSTVINNQVQYFVEQKPDSTPVMTRERMDRVAKTLNNIDSQNVLQSIKNRFGEIKENQDKLTVSKMILNTESLGTNPEELKIETQEFLKERTEEIKNKLTQATSKEDLEDLMAIMLELLNMRSDDLKDSSSILINKILDEEVQKGKALSEESQKAIEEIEASLISEERKEIEQLVKQRGEYIERLKTIEDEVNSRVSTVRAIATNYLKEQRDSSLAILTGEFKDYLPVESRMAYQENYNRNSLAIKENTIALVESSNEIIEDLQQVVKRYNNLMKLDTSIIESQQRLVDTLATQKVVERVQYSNPLSVKLNLLVSPTPNLGVSTMLKVFENKWSKMLVLDFREIISNPEGFTEIRYNDLMTGDIDDFKGGLIKVNDPLANSVDEDALKERLGVLESEFDAIFVVVDKYMTVGIDMDCIQRIIYLSDTNERNLMEVNRIGGTYEPLFDNINKRMFILNKMTYIKRQELRNLLLTANVDATKVKINTVDLHVELIDGDITAYKSISSKFGYF